MTRPSLKSRFGEQIRAFVGYKNSLGFPYDESIRILGRFDDFCVERFPEKDCLDPILAQNNPMDTMRLDELVELMLDVVCSKRAAIRIAGENMPAEVVKSRFLKLNAEHIQYVLDCLKDNSPRIRNIKQYLLATLYNAPMTIENYYAAQIDHDLCSGKR